MYEYENYIGGRDVPGDAYIHIPTVKFMLEDVFSALTLKRDLDKGTAGVEPTGDILCRVSLASDEQNTEACRAAAEAFGIWRKAPLERRLHVITRVHQELKARLEEFIQLLIAEGHGRSIAEYEAMSILDSTAPESVDSYRLMLRREITGVDTPRRLLSVRKPDGVIGLNPPQNASTTMSAMGLAAIAAGNTVVIRAPQAAPAGTHFLFRTLIVPILEEVGAPPGTVNILTAPTAEVLRNWIDSPYVDDIFYFGDSIRGMVLAQECVAQGKKPILELAGNDSFIIWKDADVENACRALADNFSGSAQLCLIPKCAIVHPDVAEQVIARMTELAEATRPHLPDHPDAVLSPVLKSDRYFEFLAEARANGATLITGGHRMDLDGDPDEAGVFIAPTLVRVDGLEKADSLRVCREETFFPLLPIVVPDVDDDQKLLEQVFAYVDSNAYGLRNSLWSRDEEIIERFITEIHNGGLLKVNDSHLGTVSPLGAHGGTGLSGGPWGEANIAVMSTTHGQGISIGTGGNPTWSRWGLTRWEPGMPPPALGQPVAPGHEEAAEAAARTREEA